MNVIPKAVAMKFGRQLLHLQKHSPQVMFAGGIAAGLASTVMACRATLKLSDVLVKTEDLQDKAGILHAARDNDYDDKQYSKDLTLIKVRTILNVSKLYAPAAGLAMISVAMLTGSHVTLNRRNASLTAAYAAVDQAFEKYRDRVKEQFGEEADLELRHGTRTVSETVDQGDGKKKVVKHTRVADGEPSLYAKFFDKFCENFKANAEYNMIFLKAQQAYANDMLQARGHVFLNEVYDMLDIPRTGAGAIVGWVMGKGGDDYIDFGIFDHKNNDRVRDFVNGREDAILLDFNVDGVIYDKI